MKSQKERKASTLAKEDIFKKTSSWQKKNLKNNCKGGAYNFHHLRVSNKSERISEKPTESSFILKKPLLFFSNQVVPKKAQIIESKESSPS